MTRAASFAALLLATTLSSAAARADEAGCRIGLGRGWPPATENYGSAVEALFAGPSAPALRFTLLPKAGAESGVLLIPGADGGDWTLRYAEAAERVHHWTASRLELRTGQAPDFSEAPMPAAIATRLVAEWRHALAAAAPDGSAAPYSEADTWLFVVGAAAAPADPVLRVSGLRPGCELGALLREQIELLIEASDEGEDKRRKRWRQLGESLDRMREVVAAMPATATP